MKKKWLDARKKQLEKNEKDPEWLMTYYDRAKRKNAAEEEDKSD